MDKFNPSYLGQSDAEAATEATLEEVKADTDNLDIPLSNVSLSIAAAAGLTNAQLRASPVPVSAASLPLPAGASTEATLALIKAKTDNLDVALSTRTKPADAQHSIIDSGTVTNLSQLGGVAVSLNTGVRDAGTQRVTIATNDVVPSSQSGTWTVQPGNTANTTAWKVDGSGVTQPVSGTVTANAGTNLNTSALALDATLTGGSQKAINRGGAKGATTAADVTSTANGADHQGLDVQVQNASLAVTGTFWQATQPVSGTVTANAGTNLNTSALALDATLTGGTQQTKVTDGTNVSTVKAASTAAIATDKALVVAVSPNNAVAVTGTFWQATQPVSGTVTANAGTNLNTSALALDATLTGGTQKAINRGGAKGATTAADITSTANGVDHQGLDVQVQNASIAVTGTFWQATQPVSGTVTANAGTNLNTSALALDATLTGGTQQSKITDGTNVATVKAASTAAGATDKALVVAISPNNTVPVSMATAPALVAGSAIIGKVAIDQTTPGTTNAVQIAGGAADGTNAVIATAIKPIAASTYAPTLFQNLGANATLNVKASTGNVLSLSCYNANASARYIQLHNTATTPAGAAVPVFTFLVPPLSQVIIGTDFFTTMGVNFATGIAFAFSTTINTYTAGAAADQSTLIQYK